MVDLWQKLDYSSRVYRVTGCDRFVREALSRRVAIPKANLNAKTRWVQVERATGRLTNDQSLQPLTPRCVELLESSQPTESGVAFNTGWASGSNLTAKESVCLKRHRLSSFVDVLQ